MTDRIVASLFPFALIFGAALLVKGYSAVGDGFSAGAVAGLGAALQYVTFSHDAARRRVGAAFAGELIVGALLVALLLLLAPALFGAAPVTHFPTPSAEVTTIGSLELHTALLFDATVAVTVYGALVGTFDRLFPPAPRDFS